ncbi:class Ia ribonucleoside-diphosphate reductase subunit beta, partial [Psychrobacter sp. 1Y1]
KDGSMIGLNEHILCQYVEYITNERMKAVNFASPYPEQTNPLPWMKNWLESDSVQVAPQEVEVSSYLVGQIDSSIDDDEFSDFDL